MTYERTDIRIEYTTFPIINLLKNRNDEKIVIFTHEWALNRHKNLLKFLFIISFLHIYHSNFTL